MSEQNAEQSAAAAKRAGMVEALKIEREGYRRAGRTDRVAEVDASIQALGGKPPAERRAPRRQTAGE
jgi:hypothetical protein